MRLLNADGNVVEIRASQLIGEGHEAQVYAVDDSTLAKVYRAPATYTEPAEQTAARIRINDHQQKLLAFPKDLPPGAVGPIEPLWNYRNWIFRKQSLGIAGYLMPRVNNAEEIDYYMIQRSREEGVTDETVVRALISLHGTLKGLHERGFVIGDLNHGNVLVKGTNAWAIDLDAGQFGQFYCNTFEPDYLDPRLMDSDPKLMIPALRHDRFYDTDSDWYSFACMVLACLTYVKPYQGSYKGQVYEERRALQRLSIFHSAVTFPKYGGARHWEGFLPDNLTTYLKRVFSTEDLRGEFPVDLLANLLPGRSENNLTSKVTRPSNWPTAQKVSRFGSYSFGLLFEAQSALDPITDIQNGELQYLHSVSGDYIRDNRHVVIANESRYDYETSGQHRFHLLHGDATITVLRGEATLHKPRVDSEHFTVDLFGGIPSISTNGTRLAWYENRELMLAYDYIGEKRSLAKSPYESNMVFVTQPGNLVSYHRTDSTVAMTYHDGEQSRELLVDFGQSRPKALRVFEDAHHLWIWSWHGTDEVQVRRFTKSGTPGPITRLRQDLVPSPQRVCLHKGSFLVVTADLQLVQLGLVTAQKKKLILDVPLRTVQQVLPHPHKNGLVVLTTQNQIWELNIHKEKKKDVQPS